MKSCSLLALLSTHAWAESPPLLVLSEDKDGDKAAIEKEIGKDDAWKTWQKSMEKSAGVVGKIAGGQKVTPKDGYDIGMAVLGGAEKVIFGDNPLIAIANGFFGAIFGSLFAPKPVDIEKKIFDDIMKVLPAKIDAEYFRLQLGKEYADIGGILDAHNVGQKSDQELVGDLIEKQEVIFSAACWSSGDEGVQEEGAASDDCLGWIEAGAFTLMYNFVDMTAKAMLTSIINVWDDKKARGDAISLYKKQHQLYLQNLQKVATKQQDWRNGLLHDLSKSCKWHIEDYSHLKFVCIVECPLAGGHDDFDGCCKYSKFPGEYKLYPKSVCGDLESGKHLPELDSWWATQQGIWEKHKATVTAENAHVAQQVQAFASLHIPDVVPGNLLNVGSGLCLDFLGDAKSIADGTKVELRTCRGEANQQWKFINGGVMNVASGKCVDILGGDDWEKDGATIELWTCNGLNNQHWKSLNGSLTNPTSGKCLDTKDYVPKDGTLLVLWTCSGLDTQKWTLEAGNAAALWSWSSIVV